MKICLLAESATNPVLSSVLDALAERHRVTVADPREMAPALARRSFPRGDCRRPPGVLPRLCAPSHEGTEVS